MTGKNKASSANEKSVIILAAGKGSRLKSLLPKVFHKIGGLSLVDHVIKTAEEIFADEISVVLSPDYIDYKSEVSDRVLIACQENPTGTGDTVKFGLEKLSSKESGWVYVLYGDVPLVRSESLDAMYKIAHQYKNTAVVILVFDSSDSKDLGRLELADTPKTIKRIVESKDISEKDNTIPLCNAGLLIRRDVLNSLLPKIPASPKTNEVYITEIVRLAYKSGYECRYFEASKEELSGVNTRADLANLEKYFQEHQRNYFLDNGVTLVAPETVFFSYDTEIEKDVTIQPYVVFKKGVKLRSGAEVGPFCVLEGSEVHTAQVGPFSRLRSGTTISDGAKIGNFVEVKNSSIGERTKVNHLTYIGDSILGHDTNIGAGTITCNYDGISKHQTKIGDCVFIGSNTALVAPVEISDKAMIGAGSVITENVDSGDLAIARGIQRNISKGAKIFKKKFRA